MKLQMTNNKCCESLYFKYKDQYKTLHWQWNYKNLQEDPVYLYVKTRTFWLVNSEIDAQKLSQENQNTSHYVLTALKKLWWYYW